MRVCEGVSHFPRYVTHCRSSPFLSDPIQNTKSWAVQLRGSNQLGDQQPDLRMNISKGCGSYWVCQEPHHRGPTMSCWGCQCPVCLTHTNLASQLAPVTRVNFCKRPVSIHMKSTQTCRPGRDHKLRHLSITFGKTKWRLSAPNLVFLQDSEKTHKLKNSAKRRSKKPEGGISTEDLWNNL